nr:hypothetical protein [Tanacetum cinerariifolium]
MSSSDSAVTYTSISSEDVPFWGVRFFGMKQPDSPEAASHHDLMLFHLLLSCQNDGDNDDGESFGDDADDEDDKDEEEEEKEHLALTDSAVVASISLPSKAEVEKLLAMPTPPPSPLTSLSPPSVRECLVRCMAPFAHSSPPPVPSPLLPLSRCPTQIQTLRMASTNALIDAITTALPSPPLPPPLCIPPLVNRRGDTLETEMPPHKRSCLFALGFWYEIGESYTARPTKEAVLEIAPMTLGEVITRVTELAELHEHDAQDLYALLEDAQDSRTHISQRSDKILGPDAYAMTWEVLKKKMTDKYYTQGEIKKLEIELWNLKVKGNDVSTYTECFQKLTLICTKFLDNETENINKYISGLPDNIFRSVNSSKLKTLDETIELANDFMDQKLHTYTERQTDNQRKADDSSRNNQGHQQQPFKRQNVAKVYNMGTGEKKPYSGNLPKCTKCHFHHNGPGTQKCHKCNKVGHFACDCRSFGNTNVANTQKGNGANPKGNVGNAEKKGNASRDPDSNVVTGTFLLNNRYASILFYTGADRTFISTAFTSLIDIVPTPLGNSYDGELADGKIVRVDTIMRGYTLNFLNHPFNIDLMPIELGSFDVIIGMDWLRRCHVVIVCDEKLVRIPYGNETLIFRGDESNDGRESRLTIISCSKAQEYMAKGCLAGYYQRFIEGFLKIVKSMTKLTQKGVKFDWGEKEENAFQLIKKKLCSASILALPKGSEDFVVYCDASHKGLGAVLMQREKVIAYDS